MKDKKIERPQCSKCENPMIFSFCIMYHEHVCIPCGKFAEMFNGLPKIETTEKEEKELKKKYAGDLQRLSFTRGGATCGKCEKRDGNNCASCKMPEKFKYWPEE